MTNFKTNKNLFYGKFKTLLLSAAAFAVVITYFMGAFFVGNFVNKKPEIAEVYAASGYWLDDAIEPSNDGTNYNISTPAELAYIADQVNTTENWSSGKTFSLTSNIDLSAKYWTPIGYHSDFCFEGGLFNGNDYIINGLIIDKDIQSGSYLQSINSVGLFGYINNSTIQNITFTNANINASAQVGTVAGIVGNLGGTISNIKADTVVTGTTNAGGLIGDANFGLTLENSTFSGSINATGSNAGGLVSTGANVNISNCYNESTVTAGSIIAGGIIGALNGGSVVDCYNTGNVSGNYSGGIIGFVNTNPITITNAYNTGLIAGNSNAGAIVAYQGIAGSTVNGLYVLENSVSVDGGSTYGNADDVGASFYTSAQMQTESTYTGDFDFTSTWEIINAGDYPTLQIFNTVETVGLTINAGANGTVSGSSANGDYEEGDVITLSAAPNLGYNFTNWTGTYQSALISTNSNTTYTISADDIANGSLSFTANFATIDYNINYELNGGINGANPATYTVEDSVTLLAPSKIGYNFTGWTEGSNIFVGSTGNKTFTANWNLINYNIAYNLNGATNNVSNPNTYTIENEDITLLAPTKVGYDFIGWAEGNTIVAGSIGDRSFTANFNQQTATVNVSVVTNGSISGSSANSSYAEGDIITLNATPNVGYNFTNWTGIYQNALVSTNANTTYTISLSDVQNGNLSFVANFEAIEYSITYELGGGTNCINPTTYTIESEDLILLAPTKGGYDFIGWAEGDIITAGSHVDKTFTATFDRITIVAMVSEEINLSFELKEIVGPYGLGDVVALQAEEKDGYRFINWTGNYTDLNFDAESSNTTYVVALEDLDLTNLTFTANYGVIPVVVTLEETTNGEIEGLSDDGRYFVGQQIVLTALAIDGYEFAGWSGFYGTSFDSENITLTYTVTQEDVDRGYLNITANFEEAEEVSFGIIEIIVMAVVGLLSFSGLFVLTRRRKRKNIKHRRPSRV